LLSPESALKKVKDQDVLFGTSSQLVGDESPTFLRDLQQAMKVSEAMPDQDSFVDSGYGDETPRPGSAKGLGTARYLSSGDLWSRAARDFEGSLLDAEVVDLAKSSPASQVHKDTKSKGEAAKERLGHFDLATASDQGGSWMVLDDLPNAEPLIAARENPRQEQEATDVDERRFMAKSIAEASLRKRPRSKSPVKKATKANGKTTTVRSSKIIQKPNFDGYPTTQLASELASYGFKPVNSRDQMIALLERCWEGKNRVALQSLGTNANLSTSGSTVSTTVTEAECSPQKRSTKASPTKKSKPASLTKLPRLGKPADEAEPAPKKPRGRPPKNTVSSTATKQPPNEARSKTATSSTGPHTPDKTRRKPTAITVEEIDDSDTPPTPSPPRRRSSPTTPRPLDVTSPTAEQTPNLTPTAAQKHLFFKITKAITTFPPTTDPKHPTWHEKILMYDPIVLEDLAAWLNTEGLGRVGVDEEVGTAVVRAWCEEKSVCCLWKENLWGGVRARY